MHTRSGPASYIDTGGPGRAALFVHGVGTSSYLWRHVIGQLDDQRRCVAVDPPLHGHTPAATDQDFSLPDLARFLAGYQDVANLPEESPGLGWNRCPPRSRSANSSAC